MQAVDCPHEKYSNLYQFLNFKMIQMHICRKPRTYILPTRRVHTRVLFQKTFPFCRGDSTVGSGWNLNSTLGRFKYEWLRVVASSNAHVSFAKVRLFCKRALFVCRSLAGEWILVPGYFAFICETWLIHSDMTHPYVGDKTHSWWHDVFICETWRIHTCDMTRSRSLYPSSHGW
jgi:hypothetical protein